MPESEILFSEVAQYLKPEDVVQLRNAHSFGSGAHSGQFRKSGEPYFSHPVAVARILSSLHLDAPTLMAALLHDVVEDTEISKAEISERFGDSVAELVDGVSKLAKIEFQTQAEAQAENFRKMLLAMARDVRVILIKLADRLHNMRTLESMLPVKQRSIARETLEIYAPIAYRLGLNNVFQELQELSFRYSYPMRYSVLVKATKAARGNRREVVGRILEAIKIKLKEVGLDAEVTGREKHLYSIYSKMLEKHLSFSEVLDIYGFRVVVKDIPSCYVALGTLHGLYRPIPGKFKDYIAIPKNNGYQSLHSTLLGPFGLPIEIQIRTVEMHSVAENGIAAHWLYKSSENDDFKNEYLKSGQWLQSLLEALLSNSSDSLEFLEHLKLDLFPGDVYVFTPQGKILTLPRGSTAVDFAYAVHSDVGNCCVAAKINGESAPLRTKLKSGDRVEIITAPYAKPNPAWLSYVATGRARSHIRHFLKNIQYVESVKLGERLLNQALQSFNINPESVTELQWEKLVRDSGVKSEDLLAEMALGKQLPAVIAKRLTSPAETTANEQAAGPIMILGTEGLTVQFAKCCRPIPGDEIAGVIKKEYGLIIHTHDCPAIANSQKSPESCMNCLDVAWGKDITRSFEVSIRVTAANKKGVLAQVAAEIAKAESNIDDIEMESGDDYTYMHLIIQVNNRQHLAQVMRGLRHIQDVIKISRIKD